MSWKRIWISYQTLVSKEITRFLRIWTQTLLPSTMTMFLYIVVFGTFLGKRIQEVDGHSYIAFIIPGLMMMSIINNSFSNVASSFYSSKFQKSIEELLVSPMPGWVMIAAYVTGGALRGIIVGALVMMVALFFTTLKLYSLFMVIAYIILTALVFATAGFMSGMFANKFDDIAIIPTFVLTPLTYFGGVFYSITLLPETWQKISLLNPILYMVNGLRYGFLGTSDINVYLGLTILSGFLALFMGVNIYLVNKGYRLRS